MVWSDPTYVEKLFKGAFISFRIILNTNGQTDRQIKTPKNIASLVELKNMECTLAMHLIFRRLLSYSLSLLSERAHVFIFP